MEYTGALINSLGEIEEQQKPFHYLDLTASGEVTVNKQPLNVLCIGGSKSEFLAIKNEFKKGGYLLNLVQLGHSQVLTDVINTNRWDIALIQHSTDLNYAIKTIELLHKLIPNTPCIILSNEDDTETAVTLMKAGASDILTKNRLSRLVPLVNNELTTNRIHPVNNKYFSSKGNKSVSPYHHLLQNSGEATFILDGNTMIDCNEKMFQIFVAEHHENQGGTPFGVSPEFQPDGSLSTVAAQKWISLAMSGQPQIFDWTFLKKAQTPVFTNVFLFPHLMNGKQLLVGVVKDITRKKEKDRNYNLEADILEILNGPEEQIRLIEKIAQKIKNSAAIGSVCIRLKKDSNFPVYVTADNHKSESTGKKQKTVESDVILERLCENILRSQNETNRLLFSKNGSLVINNIEEFSKKKLLLSYANVLTNHCKNYGFGSLAMVPLKNGNDIIGILQISDPQSGRFSKENIATFELIASSIARTIRRIRDKEEIRLNEARLGSLLRIAQHKVSSTQELFDMALREAILLSESNIGYIYYYNDAKKLFTLNTWSKGVMDQCKIMQPQTMYELEKTGYWGEAVRQGKPMINNKFQKPNKYKRGYPKGHCELHKFMTIPVIKNDKIVAVVGLANKTNDYDEKDIRQISLLMEVVWNISEQNKSENLRNENEEKFRGIVENSADSMILTDSEGKIISWNKASEEISGMTAGEVQGKHIWDIQYELALPGNKNSQYRHKLKTYTLRYCKNGISKNSRTLFDTTLINKSGQEFTLEVRIFSVKTEKGYLLGSISRDITVTKQLQQELIESRELYRTFIDSSTDMALIKDPDHRYMMVNKSFASFFNKPEEKIIGKDDFSFVPKAKALEIQKSDKAVMKSKHMVSFEDKIMDKILECRKFPVKLHNNMIGIGGYMRDITDVKKTREEELRHLKGLELISKTAMDFVQMKPDSDMRGFIAKKLREISKSSIVVVTSYNYDTNTFYVESISGLKGGQLTKVTEISGGDFHNLSYKVSPNSVRLLIKGQLEFLGDKLKSFIIRTMTDHAYALVDLIKSDNVFTIGLVDKEQLLGSLLLIDPEMDMNKLVIETFTNQASIAIHNKSMVKALHQSESRFRNLFEKNNDIIFTLDDREQITSINPIGQKLITGAIEKRVKIKNYMTSESYARLKKTLSGALAKESKYCAEEIEMYALNGKLLTFQVSFSIAYTTKSPEIFGIAQNITRNKMMQNQILSKIIETEEREKKSFAEELHDGLGSLLSTINIYIGLLQKKDKPQEQKDIYLEQLKKLVHEAVSNVRLFANSLTPNVLNDFGLLSAIRLFCDKVNTTRHGLVKFHEPENLPRLDRIVEINLYRITLELINNSLKYANATSINIHLFSREKNIILQYNDNGKGFDMDKILKSSTSGMGTKNIIARVKSLNGTCDFHSQENKGVNFNFIIPRIIKKEGNHAQTNG
jgi:PAS domain S-box-containing protein